MIAEARACWTWTVHSGCESYYSYLIDSYSVSMSISVRVCMIFRSFTHALDPWDPLGAPMEDLPLDGLALVRAWLGHWFPAIPALDRSHVLRMQNNAKQIKSNNIK